jgi:transglutaminase-like putative cysteine protease
MKTASLQQLKTIVSICACTCVVYCLALVLIPCRTLGAEQTSVMTSLSSTIAVDAEQTAQFSIAITFANTGENPTALTAYELRIGDVYPTDVQAKNGTTALTATVRESSGSVIQILLGNTVLRPGLTIVVEVTYAVEHYLVLRGGTYDAELPLFHQSDTAQREAITFSYPEALGHVNYSSWTFESRTEGGREILTFNDLGSAQRLFISIGNVKYVSVAVERSYTNDSSGYVKQEVMIPPEFSSQHFIITSISPAPESAHTTADGNFLLSYSIPGNDTLWVRATGVLVQTYPEALEYQLSEEEKETYLDTETEWWNIDDEQVLSDIEAVSNLDSLKEKVDKLYDYTIEELVLSEGFRQLHGTEFRKGASVALKTYKNASVEDYADVFVALSRYAGIPARVVAGYVFPYSVEEASLGMFHVWPQYWSEEIGWVSVDPAYEMYAGLPCRDYVGINRVVVVSSYDPDTQGPFQETSTEFIVTDETIEANPGISVGLNVPEHVHAGFTTEGELTIRNTGNRILSNVRYNQRATDEVQVEMGDAFYDEIIVPGQVISVPFTINPFDWYETGSRTLSFAVSAEAATGAQTGEVSERFGIDPLWWVEPITWLLTLMAFALFMWTIWSSARFGRWLFKLFSGNDRPKDTNIGGKIIS